MKDDSDESIKPVEEVPLGQEYCVFFDTQGSVSSEAKRKNRASLDAVCLIEH